MLSLLGLRNVGTQEMNVFSSRTEKAMNDVMQTLRRQGARIARVVGSCSCMGRVSRERSEASCVIYPAATQASLIPLRREGRLCIQALILKSITTGYSKTLMKAVSTVHN